MYTPWVCKKCCTNSLIICRHRKATGDSVSMPRSPSSDQESKEDTVHMVNEKKMVSYCKITKLGSSVFLYIKTMYEFTQLAEGLIYSSLIWSS